MARGLPVFLFVAAFLAALSAPGQEEKAGEPDVRIAAPISTKPLLEAVAQAMKRESGLQIAVTASLTSLDALEALAEKKVDIAFLTKPLTGDQRAQYPELELVVVPIGMEVVALGVSNDLWDAGVHTISQKNMRAIYEQKITNWSQIGGPNEKLSLFSFEQGGGVWEILADWLYGDNRKAPFPKVDNMATSQDARDTLEFTPGAIVPLGAGFVDGARCHALGLDLPKGIARPAAEDIASGSYPIVRPINAVVVGRPILATRAVTEFLTGPAGQALVKRSGALGLEAVPKAPADPFFESLTK